MRNTIRVLALCLVTTSAVWAQAGIVAKFLIRSHRLQGVTLPYRLFVPDNYSPAKKYPLVLTLHGSGEAGTDNIVQISSYRIATAWADPVNQAKYPCFVVSPQCPFVLDWSVDSVAATVSSLLDSLTREFTLDLNRFYVTGLSMGGFGTWDYVVRYPHRFAAAIPVSGGWDDRFGEPVVSDVPIWNFHGTVDDLVRVAYSRTMIDALKATGRSVVYPLCHNSDCRGLPDSVISMYVKSHADLFYTEYQFGGHNIWDESYNNPFLAPWLFDKFRQTTGAIVLTNLSSHRTLKGIESITWNAAHPGDSVEIWTSPDNGGSWQLVSRAARNSGTYQWDTRNVNDCAFGMLKIFVKNSEGFIYGHDLSRPFAIDNGAVGKPFAKILNEEFTTAKVFSEDTLTLRLLIGDSKSVPLTVRLSYSLDGGLHFTQFDSYPTVTDTNFRTHLIHLAPVENSDNAVIKITVDDGNGTSSDQSASFFKRTPRLIGSKAVHVAGAGGGVITVNIVDQAALTGDLYRLTFNDTSLSYKFYDVTNVKTGAKVVSRATQLDGTTEGPLFDGIRLKVKDYAQAEIDRDSTKWEVGAPTLLNVQIVVPTITIGGQTIKGYPYPADYRISFFDHIVDTSRDGIFGTGRIPVNFSVWNLTENRKSELEFIDSDNNLRISSLDEIYIYEPDSVGIPRVTWDLFFAGVPPAISVPGPGDRFVFRTLKPFRSGDAYEFRAVISGVTDRSLPQSVRLFQNYPNPFNPTTVLSYQLPVVSDVKLLVYDILGREVAVLANERKAPGSYSVKFDATGLASGVYFYRLTAGSFVQTKKLLILR